MNVIVQEDVTYHGVQIRKLVTATTEGLVSGLVKAKAEGFTTSAWHSDSGPDETWDLGIGSERSFKMATEGWRNKAGAVQTLADKVVPLARDYAEPAMVQAVAGPLWDMPAVIEGQPYCAWQFSEQPTPRLVRVVIDGFYSQMCRAADLEKRAEALSALLLTLHTVGFAVDVRMIVAFTAPMLSVSEVLIHSPGDVFDLERIAFWQGHPAAVRNLVYAGIGLYVGDGWGCSDPIPKIINSVKQQCAAEGSIFVQSAYGGYSSDMSGLEECKTPAGQVSFITRQMDAVIKGGKS